MALRFRRSIKLAPGVRMNVSGSGISWTLGPRGATIGIGKRGVRSNASLLGFSSSQSLLRTPPRSRRTARRTPQTATQPIVATCSVDDNGHLIFRDQQGNRLDDTQAQIAKTQNRETVLHLIQNTCDQINDELDALATIHLYTPPPDTRPSFHPEPYSDPPPTAPAAPQPRWWEKFLSKRLAKLEALHRDAITGYKTQLIEWKHAKLRYELAQAAQQHLIEQAIYVDTEAMARWLEINLQDIVWPRETIISLEIADQGSHVLLDVDLPEIEDMPSKRAAVPARGLKLSVKELSSTQIRKLYMAHVHGIAFRLIGETFAALPVVQNITLSGFSQRHDPATGQLRDDYLYSVKVSRGKWMTINFDEINSIDVTATLTLFELRRQMSKTGIFKPIEPF